MKRPNNVVALTTTLSEFFIYWLSFLSPFHHLTPKQIEVAAAILALRHELSKSINDDSMIDEILFNKKSKEKIRKQCGMKYEHLLMTMGDLRKKKVLIGNSVNPRFIPEIKDEKEFQLLLYFQINDKKGSA